jgi:hypothetical protein
VPAARTELVARLKADLSLIQAVIEELLRVNGSVLALVIRFDLEAGEFGG